jgi:prepilin-type N-terminal cleavage/methylation domain-containing protein
LRRRGFTLIELVVVIALIAILGTLLIIGIGKLQTNAKRQQTRQTFQTLQAMFAEYDVNRRVPYGAGNWPPGNIPSVNSSLYMSCPQNVTADYNLAAEMGSIMPTSSSTNSAADRFGMNGNVLVPITRSFMAQLLTSPNNAAAIGKLPSSQLMTFAGFDPSSLTPTVWSATNPYILGLNPYQMGEYVQDNNQNIYIRTQLKLDTSVNPQPLQDAAGDGPPNAYYWIPALRVLNPTQLPLTSTNGGTPLPTPVVLDAWGNPIVIVLGGILGAPTTYTLNSNFLPPVGSGGMITGSGSGAREIQVISPDYHPFFASAGPDGDFSKSDDNLYSFEK